MQKNQADMLKYFYTKDMPVAEKHFEALFPPNVMEEEISSILGFIKSGRSCQLLGLPGVGRSELLEILSYNASVRSHHLGDKAGFVHFIKVDFSELRGRPLFDVMKFLFLSLADSLRDKRMMEEYNRVINVFRESLSFHDELVLFQGLKEAVDYLALYKKQTLVFLFNRFEEYIPSVTNEFFRNLRVLHDRTKYRFAVVFSSNRALESLLDPSLLSDFYEFIAGNHIYIKFYDHTIIKFLSGYLEKLTHKSIDNKTFNSLIELTGGHFKLTRLGLEACHSGIEKKQDLANQLLNNEGIRSSLTEIWLELSPSEQSYLLDGPISSKKVPMSYLEDSGLTKDNKIQIPLFKVFLKTSQTVFKTSSTQIIYDENTNSIRKGKSILSDALTSSEFRLLKFLLQNQERIIERDEIISVVWSSVKSTAGITDQAVDQLIFRLRRKIEEDPMSPNHLQTVKGRGFKFSS